MKFARTQFLINILTTYINRLSLASMVAILLSCGNNTANEEKDKEEGHEEHKEEPGLVELTEEQFKTVNVQLGTVELRKLSGNIKVNGTLDVPPQQQVSISMPFGGILKSTDLLEGMRVKKGQIIGYMENPDYIQLQQDYIEAYSQASFMEQEYKRQQELIKENVTAAKTFQKTEADYKALNARIQGLRKKLALLNINSERIKDGNILQSAPLVAPINGYVTEVNANIGKYVNANEVIFEIVDTEHLHAELTVFEKDIPRLKIGDKVRFVLSNENKERTATIYLIGREISAERTVQVHSHLDKEDQNLLPGMYLKAWVEAGGTEVKALPSEAVVQSDGKNYIFVFTEKAEGHAEETAHKETEADTDEKNSEEPGHQEEGEHGHEYRFRQIEVQVGVSDGGYTEVILPDGLDPKTQIVTKGAYDLLSKMNNSEEDEGHGH